MKGLGGASPKKVHSPHFSVHECYANTNDNERMSFRDEITDEIKAL